jgi:hypothetical protein
MSNLITPIEETRAYQSIFEEGEDKGKAEGKASTLKRQLARRFGSVPVWAEPRIDTASIEQLDTWLDDILRCRKPRGPARVSGQALGKLLPQDHRHVSRFPV